MGVDYNSILEESIAEYQELRATRDELDMQIAKKFQFIKATINLLPDNEKLRYNALVFMGRLEEHGPTIAIRKVLQSRPTRWMTATQVRDLLVVNGYDFSGYRSNPLASVHSILKRLGQEGEIEATMVDGVMAWRWRGTPTMFAATKRKRRVATRSK